MEIWGHKMGLNLEYMESTWLSLSVLHDRWTQNLSIISWGSVPFKRQGRSCRGSRLIAAQVKKGGGERSPTHAIRRQVSEQTNSSDLSKQLQQGAADRERRIVRGWRRCSKCVCVGEVESGGKGACRARIIWSLRDLSVSVSIIMRRLWVERGGGSCVSGCELFSKI